MATLYFIPYAYTLYQRDGLGARAVLGRALRGLGRERCDLGKLLEQVAHLERLLEVAVL